MQKYPINRTEVRSYHLFHTFIRTVGASLPMNNSFIHKGNITLSSRLPNVLLPVQNSANLPDTLATLLPLPSSP